MRHAERAAVWSLFSSYGREWGERGRVGGREVEATSAEEGQTESSGLPRWKRGYVGSGWSVSLKETGCPGNKPGLQITTQVCIKIVLSLDFTSSMGKFNYFIVFKKCKGFSIFVTFFPEFYIFVFYKYKKIHWNWLCQALRVDATPWSCPCLLETGGFQPAPLNAVNLLFLVQP